MLISTSMEELKLIDTSKLDNIEKYLNEIPSTEEPKSRRMIVSKELYELLKKNFPDDFIFE